jgi:aminopeptidase
MMSFSLEKLFVDVFAPQSGESVSILYDLPHDEINDTEEWRDRRLMVEEWHREMVQFSRKYGLKVNPLVSYEATGMHNGVLPEYGSSEGNRVRLEDVAIDSTIIISMTQFSASAPLIAFTKQYATLRVASLPTVNRAMQETGLAADYDQIAKTCLKLAPLFEQSDGIEVVFSTGHSCYFDISDHKPVIQDNGRLHPGAGKDAFRFRNLPSGEVCVTPYESPDSKTHGEIPVSFGSESALFIVHNNQVTDVIGDGPITNAKREQFQSEKALRNIAEVAIGCNDKAVVTGNVLQDEKAGFHWAYGRSDHLGGSVSPQAFSAPDKVAHQDIVYAKGNPIVCTRLDFVFSDGTRQIVIRDGILDI